MASLLDIFGQQGFDTKPKAILPAYYDGRKFMGSQFGRQIAEYLNLNMDHGPWLAGGAVRKIYLNEDIAGSDWDFWFKTPEQFKLAEQKIKDLGASMAYTSDNAVSYKYYTDDGSIQNLQIVKTRFFDNAQQVIDQFDFTVCQLATDGNTTIIGRNTAKDLRTKTLRLNKTELPAYIMPRLVKYMVYGYRPCAALLTQIDQNLNSIDWEKTINDYEAV
jgi:hypothetical protein